MNSIRSLAQLTAALQARSVKVAGTMPEDITDKGTVSVPVDPSATASAQNMPGSGTNTKSTAVLSPPSTTTKPALETPSLSDKAASVLGGLRTLVTAAKTKQPGLTKKSEANSAPAADASQPPGDAGVPDKTKAPTPDVKADDKGELPKDGTNKDDSAGKGDKVAGAGADFDIDLPKDLMVKLAGMILSTEDGRAYATALVERSAGIEAANDIIKAACWMQEQMAEYEQAEANGVIAAEEMLKSASAEDQEKMLKLGEALTAASQHLSTPEEIQEFTDGARVSALLLSHPKVAAALGLDPETNAPAGPPVGGAGGSDPAADMGAGDTESPDLPEVGDEELDPEAIMQAIQEMVQEGELSPEVAEEVVQALQQEGGGPGDGSEAPPEGGGEELPPEMAAAGGGGPPEEEGKMAHVPESVKRAAAITLERMGVKA